jgi:hypothetical protein
MLFLCADKLGRGVPIASQGSWAVPFILGGANV